MQDFLNLLDTIFEFLRNNGLPVTIGDNSFTLSFMNVAVGFLVANMGIYWLFKIFYGD